MKINVTRFLLAPAVLAYAVAQAQEPVGDPSKMKIITDAKVKHALFNLAKTSAPLAAAPAATLPVWKYAMVSPRDGKTYIGSIVGGNPFNRGARTTNVPVVLIPLRVEFTGALVRNFDPTMPDDGCLGVGNTAMSLTQQSPSFQPYNAVINGVPMGNVTFTDAFQRASFWPSITASAPAYHLALNVSVAAKQTISLVNGSTNGGTMIFSNSCTSNVIGQDNPPRLGEVDINYIDAQLNNIIVNLGLNAGQFPFFIVYGVVITNAGSCCILGYHNGSGNNAQPTQTYGIAGYDQGYIFAGVKDISVLSHEILEWVNDPYLANLVPEWGNIGQVGGCTVAGTGQNTLETGDPLSGSLMPDVTMPNNGVTYHIQEQAFFSWFIGGPYPGAGGKYSSNGTFGGYAKSCPPGGSN